MQVTRPSLRLRAYLAGLFDGEGSVTPMISRSGPIWARRRGRRFWAVSVQVKMSSERIVTLLHALYGGSFSSRMDPRDTRWKRIWGWRVVAHGAARFLRDVRPDLREKDRQADIALELLGLNGRAIDGYLNAPEIVRRKQELVNELIRLNGRRRAPIEFDGDTLFVKGTRLP